MKLIRRLILAGIAALAAAPAQAQSWNDVLREAKGREVYWNAWAGDPSVNAYIGWVVEEVRRRFGIALVHVKIGDTAEAVSRVLATSPLISIGLPRYCRSAAARSAR